MFFSGLRTKKLLSDPAVFGRWGQKHCERFLKSSGYKTLVRNFFCKTGEIDLIMTSPDNAVVFVEVKARADEDYTAAENAITFAKKQKLILTAKRFVQIHNLENVPLRFDIVIVLLTQDNSPEIRHYKNAFTPSNY